MGDYGDATSSAMQLAQRAIAFDQAQRYEEAVYCYGEAADRILALVQSKKASPALRKNALEYVERAEFLKKDLPRLVELAKATKSPSRILLEKAEFAVLKAQLLDESGHCSLAIDWYSEAIQVCIQAAANCSEEELRVKLRKIANSALERVEHLKKVEEQKRVEALTENLPDVPVDGIVFAFFTLREKLRALCRIIST
ncbi:MIT domain protein [Teladorsagia circumcincta]|uniref:MIT domain protein n=1 Tax=Teladorsagia circumcincta TaxID=45464 RepID=A0A2G9URT6_TELCI|nr:MIT domain protein [Teladorsagia circumcincta]